MRAAKWKWTIVVLVAIGLAGLAGGSISAANQVDTVLVRLPSGDYEAEGLSAVRVADYGSFVWLEVPVDQLSLLETRGLEYEVAETTISLNGFKFDPLKGEPHLPANLQARAEAGEPGLYLVQLVAPPQDRWLAGLTATGLVTLQYYQHNTYLVWGTQAQVDQLAQHPYRRWTGPFHPAYKISPSLTRLQGRIDHVAVTFYNSGQGQAAAGSAAEGTLAELTALGGEVVQYYAAQPDGAFYTAILSLDSSRLAEVARLANVWALDYAAPEPGLDDELADQLVAGNYPDGTPEVGYAGWLVAKGVDGSDVVWADVDTGLEGSHPDITGRIAAYVAYAGAPAANSDPNGHGSHTAGAIFGDGGGGSGLTDPGGFYWGTGVAPNSRLVVQNILEGSYWPPLGGWQVLSRDSVINGAIGSNNSWYTGEDGSQGYSAAARTHDIMVRDANWDTPTTAEPIIMIFSAGNAGGTCGSGPCYTSITDPKEAKNVISVGASMNYDRAGTQVRDLAYFSSRGPAQDGRLLPTIIAPGYKTVSFNGSGVTCGSLVSGSGAAYYNYCSGTSMAAPLVSGAAALVADWWAQEGWGTPSPAMAKALLVNGAVDMFGGDNGFGSAMAHWPNSDQGWGLVDLEPVIRPELPAFYHDQGTLLTEAGQTWQKTLLVADPTQPLRITLAWSDAPGAVGANPALVNDLDLVVVQEGNTYYGNQFSDGWSVTGGSPDRLNNLENVYVQNPGQAIQITVSAASIPGDGVPYNGDATDQDFALVCWNCAQQGFTLRATPDTLAACVPETVTSTVDVSQILGYTHDVSLEVSDVAPNVSVSVAPTLVSPPGEALVTVKAGAGAADGRYTLVVSGTGEITNVRTAEIDLLVSADLPGSAALLTPSDGATSLAVEDLALTWGPSSRAGVYRLQLDYDGAFSSPVVDETDISTTTYQVGPLEPATCYFWRILGENACGDGDWAVPFRFATAAYGTQFFDNLESGTGQWSHGATQGSDEWQLSGGQSHSSAHAWFVPDAASSADGSTDSSLWNTTPLSLGGNARLSFWHRYQFEGVIWDGAVLEISVDGGVWTDLGPQIAVSGYNGTLNASTSNPLAGRQAWTGDLIAWTQVEVDLGPYAGRSVQVRWRLGCDGSVGDVGWYIDDVEVVGALSPTPWLQSDSPVALGQSMGFSAGISAGVPPLTYTWDLGGPGYGTGLDTATPVFTYTQYGTYTVVVTMENRCGFDLASGQVQVLCYPPGASISIKNLVTAGQPLPATAVPTGTGPFNYAWDFGGPGSGSGLDSAAPVYTYTLPGSYVVSLAVDGLCGSATVTEPVQIAAELFSAYLPAIRK